MTRATWYVLIDGSVVDPSEVTRDAAGFLHHKGGLAVAMRGETPSSRNIDPEEERAKVAPAKPKVEPKAEPPAAAKVEPKVETKEMKAEGGKAYHTRGGKAE